MFDATDFGYREIRVERPLKLNFQVNEERLARLKEQKAYLKLSEGDSSKLIIALSDLPNHLFTNRDQFVAELDKALKNHKVKIAAAVRKAILQALSERDEEADICTDKDGNPEPDTELRDHELVPLKENWQQYVKREVLPYVPDAWVDEDYVDEQDNQIGRVGYEINFNRYFYRYEPPRPIDEISVEWRQLEAEIAGLVGEIKL